MFTRFGVSRSLMLCVRRLLLTTALLALLPAGAAGAQAVGPSEMVTGNGRQLHPVGDLTTLGNFPTGSALTPDGRFVWTVDSGHGRNDVQVTDVASGKITQTLPLPGGFGGIDITPDGTRAYVSGTPLSDEEPSGPTKGDKGDVLHVFSIDPASGSASELDPITLPASDGGTGQLNSLPPVRALYPAGLAISPDGQTVGVALQQADKVALVSVATGAVRTVQVGRYPYGVAFDQAGRAYVSNAFDGTLSVVDVAAGRVIKTISGLGGINGQPEGMVADPRTDRLYVAITQRDQVAVVSTTSMEVTKKIDVGRAEGLGAQPTALAVDPDGASLYVANSGEDTVTVVALTDRPASSTTPATRTTYRPPTVTALRRYVASIRAESRRYAGARRAARTAAARKAALKAHRKRVAKLHDRFVKTARTSACAGPSKTQARTFRAAVLKALRGPAKRRTARLRAAQKRFPSIMACVSQGAVAGVKAYDVIGKLPVAAYPTSAQVTPDGSKLLWVAGKGFGAGPNPDFVFAGDKRAFGKVQTPYGSYVLDKLLGRLGRLDRPTDQQVVKLTPAAAAQAVPADAQAAPADTPVRGGGPIEHVFYVVRENRTYDQVFGSDPRGEGDPNLELFGDNGKAAPIGGITPNAHALTRQSGPLLDHVFANSEVSVDGHLITAGAIANDYSQKGTAANYSRPGKSFDFGIFPITFGPNGVVFDQAVRQGVSFRNYGEGAGGSLPTSAEGRESTYPSVQANSDVETYPSNVQIGCLSGQGAVGNLAACTQDSGVLGASGTPSSAPSRFNVFAAQFSAQAAAGSVPAFNYLILPDDHTNGTTPGTYSPQAEIADNDLGLGQIVDLISHSSIWSSSAIFVVEDDSQDGADHVDAHRMPALVLSPYAKRGVAVHTRFDQYSFLRTAELIAGLKPLSLNDGLATPLYDAFNATPDVEGTRFTAIRPEQSLTEVNPAAAAMSALSRALPFEQLDLVPQAVLDRILWASAHGSGDPPPRPGPNASDEEHERAVGALRAVARGADGRAWLRAHVDEEEEEGEEAEERGAAPRAKPLSAAVRASAAAQARRVLEDIGPVPAGSDSDDR